MASGISPEVPRNCKHCGRALAPEVVACSQCSALVYSDELQHLADSAKDLEAKGELRQAIEEWSKALPLLPRASRQAEWIRDHAGELGRTADAAGIPDIHSPEPENKWSAQEQRRTPLTMGFVLSLAAFAAFYWVQFGAGFGIGFAVLIFVHEMGHFIDIKRRGLPADMPIFLPGLGAYVRWRAMGVSLKTRAEVSLAGPLAGWIGAAICAFLWWKTGDHLWSGLARASAFLNLLNLIPVWVLDGGQAAIALGKRERVVLLVASLVLWIALGERAFIAVALGTGWRLFTKDLPPRPSWGTLAYFLAVLAGLGVVLRVMPGQGFGI